MEKPRIGIILSTVRQGRFADTAVRWFHDLAVRRSDLSFEIIDLRDYSMPFYGTPEAEGSEAAARWLAKLEELDGVVFVVAEYQHSIPGVLKNALDYVDLELQHKPVAFVGYGGVGAARAVEHLRLICLELEMVPVHAAVHAGLEVMQAVKANAKALSDFDFLNERAEQLLDELAWWTRVTKEARAASAHPAS
ncbi:MAG: NAD(P)H-dependent oxidoreductase [bacterium]|mgnify:CR=1 FL=1|jgi:NAD(P)H-dependent FMN reductase|nr:MAG: FMN reductase [bacterium]